jgi:hypothetical protein
MTRPPVSKTPLKATSLRKIHLRRNRVGKNTSSVKKGKRLPSFTVLVPSRSVIKQKFSHVEIPPESPSKIIHPPNDVVRDSQFSQIKDLAQPSPRTLALYRNFSHLHMHNEQRVPLAYIRHKIPQVYSNLFLDSTTSTHTLCVAPTVAMPEDLPSLMSYPVHDLVLISQCMHIRSLARLLPKTSGNPVLILQNLPHLESFPLLLQWLYNNDSEELYHMLVKHKTHKIEFLKGFVDNMRFLGIVNADLRIVVSRIAEKLKFQRGIVENVWNR